MFDRYFRVSLVVHVYTRVWLLTGNFSQIYHVWVELLEIFLEKKET